MFPTLPKPLDLDELRRSTPPINALPEGADRPFWSVMIPTYNCANYLRRTLESVLAQDPGPERMQIEIVDDCSTKDDPETVVRELGKGRIGFFRQPANQGATRTFTTCIERARGRWVHILHGDDAVLDGMYQACEQAAEVFPQALMIISPVVTIDESDNWTGVVGPFRSKGRSFLVDDFILKQAVYQCGFFAGVVVRRDAYERVGGFCTAFGHVADIDMWFRVGLLGSVASLARPYGLYRIHAGSDTSRLMVSGTNVAEIVTAIQVNLQRLEQHCPGMAAPADDWRSRLAEFAEVTAWKLGGVGQAHGRLNQAKWAWRLRPQWKTCRLYFTSWLRYLLAGSRTQELLGMSPSSQKR